MFKLYKKNKKLRIGIDINEVLRSRIQQVQKYYAIEFEESGIPQDWYVYDIFKNYKWEDTIEYTKELKEPGELPEKINPIHYQTNENGEALADYLLFKPQTETKLTAKEVYNRFMYEDYLFEIHASATMMYKNMDVHLNRFYEKYRDTVEMIVVSKENHFSIPPTLFFLSKITCRINNYCFFNDNKDVWKNADILITTDPEILDGNIPLGKKVIKLKRPYNENCNNGEIKNLLQVNDLFENKEFEKLIKYINN